MCFKSTDFTLRLTVLSVNEISIDSFLLWMMSSRKFIIIICSLIFSLYPNKISEFFILIFGYVLIAGQICIADYSFQGLHQSER
jgi:hypothetical protein